MALETAIVRAWIASKLLADSIVSAKVANRIYAGAATPNAKDFYIVYSYAGGTLTKKLGRRRRLVRLLYDIKVYQKGSGNSDFSVLADKIGEIFSEVINESYKGWNLSSELESLIDLPENDKDKDTQWSCLGGTFRISAYQL